MLLIGISMGLPLSMWNNLRYPLDKVYCVGTIYKMMVKLHKRGATSDDLELGIYCQDRGPE